MTWARPSGEGRVKQNETRAAAGVGAGGLRIGTCPPPPPPPPVLTGHVSSLFGGRRPLVGAVRPHPGPLLPLPARLTPERARRVRGSGSNGDGSHGNGSKTGEWLQDRSGGAAGGCERRRWPGGRAGWRGPLGWGPRDGAGRVGARMGRGGGLQRVGCGLVSVQQDCSKNALYVVTLRPPRACGGSGRRRPERMQGQQL